jgi:hypothetical protein
MPRESRLLSSTPLPLPAQSVSVEVGKGVHGQDTGSISSSHDKIVFSGLSTLEAGEREEINLVYDLPKSILKEDDGGLQYELFIQKQPGIRERSVLIQVVPPAGYIYESSSHQPFQIEDSRISFSLDLTSSVELTINFKGNINDPV